MFITKDGVTIALDTIATVGVAQGIDDTRLPVYWLVFHLKLQQEVMK